MYNTILGRPSLNFFKEVISTTHLVMKFPSSNGVGIAKAGSKDAHECYIASLPTPIEKHEEELPSRETMTLVMGFMGFRVLNLYNEFTNFVLFC